MSNKMRLDDAKSWNVVDPLNQNNADANEVSPMLNERNVALLWMDVGRTHMTNASS